MPTIYLNELSFDKADVLPYEAVAIIFSDLIDLLRALNREVNGLVIASHVRLTDLVIGVHPISRWLGGDRDRVRRLRAFDNRSPTRFELSELETLLRGVLEYRVQDRAVIGLGLASWHETLAVSLNRTSWNTSHVDVSRCMLIENEEGDLENTDDVVSARHANAPEHLRTHVDWFGAARAASTPRTPDELWRRRRRWFPNIRFLQRVESQIRDLPAAHPWFSAIMKRLLTLQKATERWDGRGAPMFGIKISGEGEQRRRLCYWTDQDGVERLFDQHARFTPGPGRIHFRLDGANRRLVIAHVGRKLDA